MIFHKRMLIHYYNLLLIFISPDFLFLSLCICMYMSSHSIDVRKRKQMIQSGHVGNDFSFFLFLCLCTTINDLMVLDEGDDNDNDVCYYNTEDK